MSMDPSDSQRTEPSARTPASQLLWFVFAILIVVLLFNVVLVGSEFFLHSGQAEASGKKSIETAKFINRLWNQIWTFAMPLLQLSVLLVIILWFVRAIGFDFKKSLQGWKPDMPALITLLVVGSFCLAMLAGVRSYSNMQMLVMVVVGFYFGSQVGKSRRNDDDRQQ
ncbi:MAG: hypothetical protein OEU46_09245 [Alphaproteobacteria bacterium]|nr:hypothetical protein [Alphaproteobacteria bacterium]